VLYTLYMKKGFALTDKRATNIFFQTVGTLFSYNLGLTSHLAAYGDMKLTLGTRHLLVYVYGVGYTRHVKDLRIVMYTFPTFVPFKYTRWYGSQVAKILVRLSVFEKATSKFDILHINDRAYPYTKAATKLKKKTVLTLHWFPSKVDEDVVTKVSALVAPSENAARVVEERFGFRPKVIYHGVDTSLFNAHTLTKTEARRHIGLPQGRKIIFWNGRLDPIKDPKTLVDAIPTVVREFPDSIFIIKTRTNRSNILQFLKKRIKRTEVEKNVKLMFGWDFISEMPYYYRSADVCVHTSLSEVCGLVAIEAMACGVPLIITDIPKVKDPAGDAALLFEPKNSEDLAEKIIKVLSNEKFGTMLREKGLRQVSEVGLTWKKAAERYRELYLSLL
jgi:glycosyltransferase involved in cell wall biosynthesis